jgi:diguanylate cyclase (GGDEF)-like protein
MPNASATPNLAVIGGEQGEMLLTPRGVRDATARDGADGGSSPTRPRVLVVDDDALVLIVTSHILRSRGFPCETLQDGREAVDTAVAFAADVVLLDVHMEPMPGAAVLRRLRCDYRTALTPVICVTGDEDPSTLVALLGAGADDYLGKPFKADELEARILVAARRRAVLGSVNPLTGMPGNVVLTAAIDRRLRDGELFALLHIDVDNFKAYNDRYGFVRGDVVIASLGRLLHEAVAEVGPCDCMLAHIGGDDFAILTSADEAEPTAYAVLAAFDRVAVDLCDAVDVERGHIVITDRSGNLRAHPLLSLSIGVATTRYRRFASAAAMADVAVEVKAHAKREPGSALVVDRRRS